MTKDDVDFHAVREEHKPIDARLVNWARWASGGRGGSDTTPMFRQYRSSEQWHAPEVSVPIDKADAVRLEKAVTALPEKHRMAIVWSYIKCHHGVSVRAACRALAVAPWMLAEIVHDGRTMLRNRIGSA